MTWITITGTKSSVIHGQDGVPSLLKRFGESWQATVGRVTEAMRHDDDWRPFLSSVEPTLQQSGAITTRKPHYTFLTVGKGSLGCTSQKGRLLEKVDRHGRPRRNPDNHR